MIQNIIAIAIFALASTSFAGEITNLKVVGKDHVQGQKLYTLHAMANQQLKAMGESVQDFELVGITMEAKSRRGQGTATLMVGNDMDTRRVDKFGSNELFFEITAPWAFNTMHWDLSHNEGQPDERWQLQLNGDIRVHSIQLHVAVGTKRVRIEMGDQIMTQQSTIFIRQELERMGYDTRRADLRRVVLVAKSRAGHGQGKLQVGNNPSVTQDIEEAQNGLGFQSDRPLSYNQVLFRNTGDSQGVWQLHLRGNIKVKALIVDFK